MFETSRDTLIAIRDALDFAPDWLVALVILGLAVTLALLMHRLATHLLARIFGRRPYSKSVLLAIQGPTRLALMILAFGIALPTAPLESDTSALLLRILLLTVIGLIGWTVMTGLNTAANLYLMRFSIDAEDNLLARKHFTQVRILLRTADVLVIIITVSAGLMTFEPVRQYGVSLFASAGVAGLVVGLAARPVLSNLLAGVQLAITQPIRIDDVVIVENEFGWVEDISATYVVLRLWDWRRMVVPLTYFIEKPFQNWTRESTSLIGTVLLDVDYTTPVNQVRAKAEEITKASPLWDGNLIKLQVTDSDAETMELRIIVTARSSGDAFDLRCELREKLIAYLQAELPGSLPHRRQEAIGLAAHAPDVRKAT